MIGRADIEGSSGVAMSGLAATSQLSLWCTAPVKLPTCHCPGAGRARDHVGPGLGLKREPAGARLPASPVLSRLLARRRARGRPPGHPSRRRRAPSGGRRAVAGEIARRARRPSRVAARAQRTPAGPPGGRRGHPDTPQPGATPHPGPRGLPERGHRLDGRRRERGGGAWRHCAEAGAGGARRRPFGTGPPTYSTPLMSLHSARLESSSTGSSFPLILPSPFLGCEHWAEITSASTPRGPSRCFVLIKQSDSLVAPVLSRLLARRRARAARPGTPPGGGEHQAEVPAGRSWGDREKGPAPSRVAARAHGAPPPARPAGAADTRHTPARRHPAPRARGLPERGHRLQTGGAGRGAEGPGATARRQEQEGRPAGAADTRHTPARRHPAPRAARPPREGPPAADGRRRERGGGAWRHCAEAGAGGAPGGRRGHPTHPSPAPPRTPGRAASPRGATGCRREAPGEGRRGLAPPGTWRFQAWASLGANPFQGARPFTKKELFRGPASFSGFVCVTALGASRRPSPPLRVLGSEPDSLRSAGRRRPSPLPSSGVRPSLRTD
ncbi:hypothetical protein G5714_024678 [Onychostoma macrolepis]|uniref:Uncharacterized protein n=1 Tax=Onychostoma macrolepis TaxID=369639 RepID=A0A7J6BI46_9TELE|nr:hypothetical protein G5714_024678 [Onychostoma macrolepis]